jgi:DNA gyrase subunit B
MIRAEKDGITVEVAMWWNDSYHENVLCFTNNIPQRDGGTHLAGFRGALTRAGQPATPTRSGIAKKEKVDAHRRRLPRRPDLRAVGQGAGPEILVADQGQAGLVRSAPVVENVVSNELGAWFEEHPRRGQVIVGKVVEAAPRAKRRARRAN